MVGFEAGVESDLIIPEELESFFQGPLWREVDSFVGLQSKRIKAPMELTSS
jgi:hypothetical protein